MRAVLIECHKFILRQPQQNACIFLGWIAKELGAPRGYLIERCILRSPDKDIHVNVGHANGVFV